MIPSGGGRHDCSVEEESRLRLVAVEGEEVSVVGRIGEEGLTASPLIDGDDAPHGPAEGKVRVGVGDAAWRRGVCHALSISKGCATLHCI